MIKVSVIVPVYNAERYLKYCLDSILSQTFKEIELICVDDGSTDASLRILRSYAERDMRIKVLTQKNQFAGAARNHGMEKTMGQYLLFLDADDFFKPDMIEKMYRKAEEEKADIVLCRYEQYCEKTKRILTQDWSFIDSFFEDKRNFSGSSLRRAGVFQITRGWTWDKLFRTDFVKACGYKFPDFRSSEDGFFVYMLMARAMQMTYADDILVTHRVNDPSSLSNTREKNWLNGFKMMEMIRDELKRQGLYEIYEQSFLNEVLVFFAWYLETMRSFEAYKNCFTYLQIVFEPETRVLEKSRKFYFKSDLYDWYQELIDSSLSEHLYRKGLELDDQLEKLREGQQKLSERTWPFPYRMIPKGKKLVLYGAGKMGASFYPQLRDSQFCKDILWVDTDHQKYADKGLPVQSPELIRQWGFDQIFLAVKDKKKQTEIKEQLLKQGIRADQIIGYGQEQDGNEDTSGICNG